MTRRIWTPVGGGTLATSLGRKAEYGLRSDEERFERWKEETRHPLWRAALNAAMENKHEFSRRLVRKEGIPISIWPESGPLNGKEKTLLLATLKDMWGLPYECGCPNAPAQHVGACTPFKPFGID